MFCIKKFQDLKKWLSVETAGMPSLRKAVRVGGKWLAVGVGSMQSGFVRVSQGLLRFVTVFNMERKTPI